MQSVTMCTSQNSAVDYNVQGINHMFLNYVHQILQPCVYISSLGGHRDGGQGDSTPARLVNKVSVFLLPSLQRAVSTE